jgi:hypothetical protein
MHLNRLFRKFLTDKTKKADHFVELNLSRQRPDQFINLHSARNGRVK